MSEGNIHYIDGAGEIALSKEGIFLWRVPHVFFFHNESKHYLLSPWFYFAGERWRLSMKAYCSNCRVHGSQCKFVGLFVWNKLKLEKTPRMLYEARLGVRSPSGEELYVFSGDICPYYGSGKWDLVHISSRSVVQGFRNNLLIFFCELQKKPDMQTANLSRDEIGILSETEEANGSDEGKETEAGKKKSDTAKGVDKLAASLENLFEDVETSDVLLKVGCREFRVHRCILGARSPVFYSMFHHDTSEKEKGVVDILDCPGEPFEIFLRYLYTGGTENIAPNNVSNLYYAADKYQVDDLKTACTEFMKNTLTVETFCDTITLSLSHNESGLLKAATEFFCKNAGKIIKTVQWQKFLSENPIPANELFIKANKF